MHLLKRSLPIVCILIPAAALLSLGCGIFTAPFVGPKALVTNAKYIHFTVDITDETGAPLKDVKVTIRKYSIDNDLLFGEVDKSTEEEKTVSGRFEYSDFGHYGVWLQFSKQGYYSVEAVYANGDQIKHSGQPFGRPGYDEKAVNVEKFPQQHVLMSPKPATPGSPSGPQ